MLHLLTGKEIAIKSCRNGADVALPMRLTPSSARGFGSGSLW